MKVIPVWHLQQTADSIRALQGTVELRACLADRPVNTVNREHDCLCRWTAPQLLIGRDLINGLRISIHGRGCQSGPGAAERTQCMSTRTQVQSLKANNIPQ